MLFSLIVPPSTLSVSWEDMEAKMLDLLRCEICADITVNISLRGACWVTIRAVAVSVHPAGSHVHHGRYSIELLLFLTERFTDCTWCPRKLMANIESL